MRLLHEVLISKYLLQGSKNYVRRVQDEEDEDLDEDFGQSSSNPCKLPDDNLKVYFGFIDCFICSFHSFVLYIQNL